MTSLFEVSAVQFVKGTDQDLLAFDVTMSDVTVATYQWAREAVSGLWSRWLLARPNGSPLQLANPHLEGLVTSLDYKKVMDRDSLLSKDGVYPEDHLFKAMARNGMLIDHWALFKAGSSQQPSHQDEVPPLCEAVGVFQLGSTVCGHVGIVHGGLTAALIDEMCGTVLYLAKSHKLLDFKVVLTANLDVQYKQPLTPERPVVVTTTISQVVGRKVWVEAVVSDLAPEPQPGAAPPSTLTSGKVFATAKALFIIPRPEGPSTAALQQAASQPGLATGQSLGYKVSANEGNPSDV